jgi:hypothetical protein
MYITTLTLQFLLHRNHRANTSAVALPAVEGEVFGCSGKLLIACQVGTDLAIPSDG